MNNYEWWKMSESYEDSGENNESIRQYFAQVPGCTSDDAWANQFGLARHFWSKCEFPNADIFKWDPGDSSAGSTQVEIGLPRTPISWTFNAGGGINDTTKPSKDNGNWFIDPGITNKCDLLSFDPGSHGQYDEISCPYNRDVVIFTSRAYFNHMVTGEVVWLQAGWRLYRYC